ncbi:acetyl-CoA carboxylase biotin carboxyl carrier protein subunit [Bizionia paragorgiae]|uniref:acetyl-CoA carboxylase biotin carboxyl carrier protein subunit n=1 Tax=Bizionia paragorgiae TaxID=283786 RepID=UPI00299CE4C4|nr:acetyl-CoA carboxylase biotin carboxyl carrier protein subunit [Bizionia paragorgiae]MDX1272695.1 acetyl-CoA carboxylase biotin carboxyl carrier protein subunit [Bizionia paragorgiae]
MIKTYKTSVNSNYDFELSEDNVLALDALKTAHNSFHILENNTSFKANIIASDFNTKSYKVEINNTTYNVQINDALDGLIKDMGFEIGASKTVNDIKAPMPGLILSINVNEGQEVKENDPLLILEAMKMENVFNSPRDGVIKSIAVKTGDAVEKNQLLIEFEN